jgi:hypothetical protein
MLHLIADKSKEQLSMKRRTLQTTPTSLHLLLTLNARILSKIKSITSVDFNLENKPYLKYPNPQP